MKLVRPNLDIGVKTFIALSILFWVPVISLAAILFYMFQNLMYEEVQESIKINLKAAKEVFYEERVRVAEGILTEMADRPDVEAALSKRDKHGLQSILINLGKKNPHMDILMAVSENQQVIARKTNFTGDVIDIGATLSNALTSGASASSTELVGRDFLKTEVEDLNKQIKDVSLVQFVVAPVRHGGKVIGALVAGIPYTGDPWLGNIIYNKFGTEMAVFAGETPESFLLHTTASLPRSTWVIGQAVPQRLKDEISLGKPYYGTLEMAGKSHLVAYEPILDSKHRIIGAIGVSMPAKALTSIVFGNIWKGTAAVAVLGLIISIIVTTFIKLDITRPLNFVVNAMESFGKGDLEISLELKTGDQFEKLGDGFNHMADGIRKREERLKKHNDVAKLLMSTLDLKELLGRLMNIVINVTESSMGIVYLYEEGAKLFVPSINYGTVAELRPIAFGEGYPGMAAQENRIIILRPPADGSIEKMELGYTKAVPNEVAYIPLRYQERILGVLVLGSVKKYSEEEAKLFEYLASQISIALDNAIMHQKIQELSITDSLTGLYNRRYLNARLEEEWARTIRHNKPLSVILSDIDNFKSINDTFGHDKGDEVLKAVSSIVKANVRKEDLASRYGGEEFVVALVDTSKEDATRFAERIRELVRAQTFKWTEKPVTISIGVVCNSDFKAAVFDELIQAADHAMYKAKTSGKDKVCTYTGNSVKT